MSSISVECPACHQEYTVNSKLIGRKVTCSNGTCGTIFIADDRETETPQPPPVNKTIPAQSSPMSSPVVVRNLLIALSVLMVLQIGLTFIDLVTRGSPTMTDLHSAILLEQKLTEECARLAGVSDTEPELKKMHESLEKVRVSIQQIRRRIQASLSIPVPERVPAAL